jgi:hypothetical protein
MDDRSGSPTSSFSPFNLSNMKNSSFLWLLGGCCLLFAACSPVYYIPNSQNVPLFTEQGQVSVMAAGNSNQVELQGAYAAGTHLGVMLNTALYLPNDESSGNGGSGFMGEAGAGYFTPVGSHFTFETYGLLGIGTMENHFPSTVQEYPNTTGEIQAVPVRLGVQPSFGFKSRYFSAAVSSRLQSLSYAGADGELIFEGQDQVAYLKSNQMMMQVEPALTLRAGIEHLKLQAQVLRSFNLTNPDFRQETGMLTLGVIVSLN